ncbi:beta-galactosidase [Hyphomonas johnsonii]|uniref:Beta-galactosidase n=1 Tax=Hyphomonas johnsonii MHS-2 TaxID=1280950 RepID=A0A059FRU3_9PROT|nr:beta-galactosidase [Hyphomonas johnsonii]KCZ93390.1 glycoside hydrolase family protein [Hyphomonas johnsonii MHS-2]
MNLGVCYYPEHWPEADWADDARRMRALGLDLVRIGEFAWSKIEPAPGVYTWSWLDRAIEVLHAEGLGIILCTPTATPPKWLVDLHPEILPWDKHGNPKRFGSRRHYCFSSPAYRRESARITEALARRYGDHPAVVMWQTDNEYGHHGTHESYSPDAARAFRRWLQRRYESIDSLNTAWGTAFWSQDYRSFDEVDPPNATVTESNPSQHLDYQRFSSDEICEFNREQVDILRRYSPGRRIAHNYIGDFTKLDHHAIGASLDIAAWDSYPIGLLSEGDASEADKAHWLHHGHPDFAAFNHDVFRQCSAQWGVMEQQPGPVNWATHNAAPAPGMVRLWTWEAFAHGAEFVSYFRWRQAPFAQEQMHAGLLLPDRQETAVLKEVALVSSERDTIGTPETTLARVAIVLDYPSLWQQEIQPQGRSGSALKLARALYSGCRKLGLDVDIIPQGADMSAYALIILPSVSILDAEMCGRLRDSGASVLAMPLTGSRTCDGHIPENLSPGPYANLLPMQVRVFESLPPYVKIGVNLDGQAFSGSLWRESVTSIAQALAVFENGEPAWLRNERMHYLACWPDEPFLLHVLRRICREEDLEVRDTGRDLRLRRAGNIQFAFNYGSDAIDLACVGAPEKGADYLIGARVMQGAGVAAWRIQLVLPDKME